MNHGTGNAYNKGCRCDICHVGHTARMRATRVNLHARPRSDVPHGTTGGYTNWGCRCRPCSEAHLETNRPAQRRYQAKKRAERLAVNEQH